jgi:hypothetical protein
MSSLSSLSLSASFNRAYTFGPHPVVLQITSLYHCRYTTFVASIKNPRRRHLSLSSHPLAFILSLFIFVVVLYIYVTNRSIQASQEFGP